MSPFLATALAAAEAAEAVIRAHYKKAFEVRIKADASPVTEVDEAAEAAIKAVLRTAFPDHGFYGEETGWDRGRDRDGHDNADAEYLWLVDPIDGTKAFVRGYPFFSTQIALMKRDLSRPDAGAGELIVGVSRAPCYFGDGSGGVGAGECYYAERGAGAWQVTAEGPQPLAVSDFTALNKSTLSLGNIASLCASPAWPRLGALIPQLHRIRGYADFLHYHLLASGRIDACVESNVNILDIAALAVIVREAGGTFTELDGAPITLATTTVLASNGRLHESFRNAIAYPQGATK